MLVTSFQRRCAVMMVLLINLPRPFFTHQVYLNITVGSTNGTIKLEDKVGSTFVDCVCGAVRTCKWPFEQVFIHLEPTSQALSAEDDASYISQTHYVCKYFYSSTSQEVACTNLLPLNYPRDSCTIKFIITCTDNRYVVLTWHPEQKPIILSFTGMQVIDCCKTSPTTTELTTTTTTPTSTSFTSTPLTTDYTITTVTDSTMTTVKDGISITNNGFRQSTAPTSDNIPINNTQLDSSNQHQGMNDASPPISCQYVGIIVGIVVAAILITIAIIFIVWKLRKRMKNRRSKNKESVIPISENVAETRVDELRHTGTEEDKKNLKTVDHLSSLPESIERDNQLSQASGDYTYVDVNLVASSKTNTSLTTAASNTSLTYLSRTLEEQQQNSTTGEASRETQDSEYSHLGACETELKNPYNWLDHQSSSSIIQPVIIPVLQTGNKKVRNYLDWSDIRPTNHHIPEDMKQKTGADENSSLYSKLGESNLVPDNTYDVLHNFNDEPIAVSQLTPRRVTTNPSSEAETEIISPPANQKGQLFPKVTHHKGMDIVDGAPYKYTEVIPKTKRVKSKDSDKLTERSNQTVLSSSSSDHCITPEAEHDEDSSGIAVAKSVVKENKESSQTDEGSRQVYANTGHYAHGFPDQANSGFPFEDFTYANVG